MLKVIIADDEKKICQLLQLLVDWKNEGFDIVDVCHDGQSLLQAVEQHHPDLVVTDIRMPGMTGLEILHTIREQEMDTDIIIMSGYREFDYARMALRDGATDYLLKPIGRDALEDCLQRIRAKREAAMVNQQYVADMQKTIENYSEKLHRDLIREVLDGHLCTATAEDLNREYGCGFSGVSMWFAAIKFDLSEMLYEKTDEVVHQKIRTITRKELEKANLKSVIGGQGNFGYVLMDVQQPETAEQCLYHLIYEVRDFFCKWDTGHVTVGIAPVEDGDLQKALFQSRVAARDQIIRGADKLLTYRLPSAGPPAQFPDRQLLTDIRNALTGGSVQQLEFSISKALNQLRASEAGQSGEAVYSCIRALEKQMMELCRSLYEDGAVDEVLEKWSRYLDHCWDWDCYYRIFAKQSWDVLRVIANQQQRREKRPVRRMKRIMEERFGEDLSLEGLAEELDLSPAYVSKLFKRELGVNFSQYLNTLRLEEAKRLLATTNDSVSQIAEAIGYHDEKYFSRLFKKEIGLTTGEYRRLYGE